MILCGLTHRRISVLAVLIQKAFPHKSHRKWVFCMSVPTKHGVSLLSHQNVGYLELQIKVNLVNT